MAASASDSGDEIAGFSDLSISPGTGTSGSKNPKAAVARPNESPANVRKELFPEEEEKESKKETSPQELSKEEMECLEKVLKEISELSDEAKNLKWVIAEKKRCLELCDFEAKCHEIKSREPMSLFTDGIMKTAYIPKPTLQPESCPSPLLWNDPMKISRLVPSLKRVNPAIHDLFKEKKEAETLNERSDKAMKDMRKRLAVATSQYMNGQNPDDESEESKTESEYSEAGDEAETEDSDAPDKADDQALNGSFPCTPGKKGRGQPCRTCKTIITADIKGYEYETNQGKFDCKSENTVYLMTCSAPNCKWAYVGETDNCLSKRMSGHRKNKQEKEIYKHFYQQEEEQQKHHNMRVSVIQVPACPATQLTYQSLWISRVGRGTQYDLYNAQG